MVSCDFNERKVFFGYFEHFGDSRYVIKLWRKKYLHEKPWPTRLTDHNLLRLGIKYIAENSKGVMSGDLAKQCVPL